MKKEIPISHSRLLAWDESLNSRELGGYPTAEGGIIRWKTLVRSETTWRLNPTGRQALLDYGIRTVIDLRFLAELEEHPSPFALSSNGSEMDRPDYIHIPLDRDQDFIWTGEGSPAAAMQDLYCRLLEANRGHVAKVLSTIASARPGGVLFHCFAGKDRTGLISAMVLGAAGVARDLIISDYAYAHPRYMERRDRDLLTPDLTPQKRDFYSVLSSNLPETMALTLDYLDQHFGGVKGYLATTPLDRKVLDAMLERIVERPAPANPPSTTEKD